MSLSSPAVGRAGRLVAHGVDAGRVTTLAYGDTRALVPNTTDANRAFAKEFGAANKGNMPTMVQAGVYSAVFHYLKAVHDLKADGDGRAVVAEGLAAGDRVVVDGQLRLANGTRIAAQRGEAAQPPKPPAVAER